MKDDVGDGVVGTFEPDEFEAIEHALGRKPTRLERQKLERLANHRGAHRIQIRRVAGRPTIGQLPAELVAGAVDQPPGTATLNGESVPIVEAHRRVGFRVSRPHAHVHVAGSRSRSGRPRERRDGAGGHRRRRTTRSSAKSGDSPTDDGGSEPGEPPRTRLCGYCNQEIPADR